SMTDPEELTIQFAEDRAYEVIEARILKGSDVHDRNTFEEPDKVSDAAFNGIKAKDGKFELNVPAASVILIRVK
ncbi:MAG: alpha-N-arabinofuranosidase, partial [Lachnospiraceae bacterium]|nr:alpha-N-arabinofuranosidase [Lachnospiraceae bacterium]